MIIVFSFAFLSYAPLMVCNRDHVDGVWSDTEVAPAVIVSDAQVCLIRHASAVADHF